MRFVGRGHPAIRATHTKTLELTPGEELTERGTCIVAVGAEAQPPQPMAGPVRIRITAGDRHASVHATANSSWDPTGAIVVRRGPLRLPGTFATAADTAAADLPRDLVDALRDPDALVTVDVVAVRSERPTLVLFAADSSRPHDPRLLAEAAAADTIEAQDAGARSLVGTRRGDGPRRLVVATVDLPRATAEEGTVIEVVGLPEQVAVAAAGPGPFTVVPAEGDLALALRRATAGTRVATVCTPTELVGLLELARRTRGSSRCVVAQPFGPVIPADAEHPPTLFGREPVFVCFAAIEATDALDPDVRTAITGLLADGVSTKTAAAALAALTGRSRRGAYDDVLALARDPR